MDICSIPECQRLVSARGWCNAHYKRWHTHGDPLKIGEKRVQRYLREVVLEHDADECLFWPFSHDGKGYGQVTQGGKVRKVTRIVCEAAHGPAPTDKHEAAHSCGNGHLGCCALRHLRWATHAENMADAVAHGSVARGSRVSGAKLTEADIRQIRSLAGVELQRVVAEQFGVSAPHVSDIQNNKTWTWVK